MKQVKRYRLTGLALCKTRNDLRVIALALRTIENQTVNGLSINEIKSVKRDLHTLRNEIRRVEMFLSTAYTILTISNKD